MPSSSSRPDFLIVGAGIIGCAVAESLSRGGHAVRVVDMRAPGQGATQASAGVLAPYIEGHEPGPLRVLGRRSLDITTPTCAACRPTAACRCATRAAARSKPPSTRPMPRGFASRVRRWPATAWRRSGCDGAALRAAEPAVSHSAVGALHIPVHGYVGVLDLTLALAAAAQKRGAVFSSGVQVSRVVAARDGLWPTPTPASSPPARW